MVECACSPATVDGRPWVRWVGHMLHDCVWSPAEFASVLLGLVSIGIWMVAVMPQVYSNFVSKRVEALSFTFLLQWLGGDVSNLLGCLWTHQLPTQLYQGAYFVCTDVLLLGQWLYYTYVYPRLYPGDERARRPLIPQKTVLSALFVGAMLTAATQLSSPLVQVPPSDLVPSGSFHSGRVLLSLDSDHAPSCDAPSHTTHFEDVIGSVMAWISAMLYFFSRVPQIVKNFRRRSLAGINIFMFILAILANVTYGLSVILRVPAVDSAFYKSTLPYIIGSIGTLVFDMTICAQYCMYGAADAAEEEPEEDCEYGEGTPHGSVTVRSKSGSSKSSKSSSAAADASYRKLDSAFNFST